MTAQSFVAASAAFLLAGCTPIGPRYERPPVTTPETYSTPSTGDEVPVDWWTLFGQPALDGLVQEALSANQDLALAAARVEESRALAGIARADRFPSLDAGVSASSAKLSASTLGLPKDVEVQYEDYRASGSLSFELDFWGRLRRAHEAARADLLASEEGRRNVRLAVTADVTTGWFDLLALDQQLAIARDTLQSRIESVRLQRLRFDAGTISELDLSQAEAELAATEATVPRLERSRRQAENRMAILLGRVGGEVERHGELAAIHPPEVPVGLPSDLLGRRPDVVAAEQRLVAANARIGVARAALFPSITLTASAGSESPELSDLFATGTGVWQMAAGLLQPIFHGGKLRRQVEVAEARQRQELASYTKALQTAFADVEDALVARRTGSGEREAVERQVAALARARQLARLRYDAGEASYLEVLDAERNLFRADLDLVGVRRAELGAAVALFKALGGGWANPTVPPTTTPSASVAEGE